METLKQRMDRIASGRDDSTVTIELGKGVVSIGSVVSLKSGGPTMTVSRVIPMDVPMEVGLEVACVVEWFDADNRLQQGKFWLAQLTVYEEQ